mmetsp:Transcript_55635/g.169264  ORF Transcript_55635/g.169264 Transcript_55635/m.169264 type:complete len:272 (+) Transcript_55635:1165-1980(+)
MAPEHGELPRSIRTATIQTTLMQQRLQKWIKHWPRHLLEANDVCVVSVELVYDQVLPVIPCLQRHGQVARRPDLACSACAPSARRRWRHAIANRASLSHAALAQAPQYVVCHHPQMWWRRMRAEQRGPRAQGPPCTRIHAENWMRARCTPRLAAATTPERNALDRQRLTQVGISWRVHAAGSDVAIAGVPAPCHVIRKFGRGAADHGTTHQCHPWKPNSKNAGNVAKDLIPVDSSVNPRATPALRQGQGTASKPCFRAHGISSNNGPCWVE